MYSPCTYQVLTKYSLFNQHVLVIYSACSKHVLVMYSLPPLEISQIMCKELLLFSLLFGWENSFYYFVLFLCIFLTHNGDKVGLFNCTLLCTVFVVPLYCSLITVQRRHLTIKLSCYPQVLLPSRPVSECRSWRLPAGWRGQLAGHLQQDRLRGGECPADESSPSGRGYRDVSKLTYDLPHTSDTRHCVACRNCWPARLVSDFT